MQMNMPNSLNPDKWVLLNYVPYEPTKVYGIFNSMRDAQDYAMKNEMAEHGDAYEIKLIMDPV